jgi:DNA polymerase III subunit epsilon
MRALIFDCETTGMIEYRADEKDSRQPHIVALAAGVYEDGSLLSSMDVLIRPDGFTIPEEVSKIHGITQRDAAQRGVNLRVALSMLCHFARTAPICASYGLETFDAKMIRLELARFNIETVFPPAGVEGFCVRKAAQAVCKVPGDDGGYRAPDLATASLTILQRPLRSRKLMDQVGVIAELFFELKSRGL